jgi:hypothetical protein
MKNTHNDTSKKWDKSPIKPSQMPSKPLTLYRAYQASRTGRSKLNTSPNQVDLVLIIHEYLS